MELITEVYQTGTDCSRSCIVYCRYRPKENDCSERQMDSGDSWNRRYFALRHLGIYKRQTVGSGREAALAIFTAIVQGVLAAGASTYVNQILKQLQKENRLWHIMTFPVQALVKDWSL